MAATLGVLTVLAGIVSFGVLSRDRSVGRVVSVVSSVLLLLSGAYVIYHWLTAGRFLLALGLRSGLPGATTSPVDPSTARRVKDRSPG